MGVGVWDLVASSSLVNLAQGTTGARGCQPQDDNLGTRACAVVRVLAGVAGHLGLNGRGKKKDWLLASPLAFGSAVSLRGLALTGLMKKFWDIPGTVRKELEQCWISCRRRRSALRPSTFSGVVTLPFVVAAPARRCGSSFGLRRGGFWLSTNCFVGLSWYARYGDAVCELCSFR